MVDCDGDIEEHFRRSLGNDYSSYLNQSSNCHNLSSNYASHSSSSADSAAVRHQSTAAQRNDAAPFISAADAQSNGAFSFSSVVSNILRI